MDCFSSGQAYVALSRVRDLNGLYLKRKLPYLHEEETLWGSMVSEDVVAFYGFDVGEVEDREETVGGAWYEHTQERDIERNLDKEWEEREKRRRIKTLSSRFESASQILSDDVRIEQYRAVFETAQAELGVNRFVFDVSYRIGRELLEKGDVENAERWLIITLEGREKCLGENDRRTFEALLAAMGALTWDEEAIVLNN